MELAALMEAASYAQEADLPEGVGALSAGELRFVTGILRHGNQGKAYMEAGFKATGEAAYVGASKLLRKAKVARFYRQCLGNASQDALKLMDRASERSIRFHESAMEAGTLAQSLRAKMAEPEWLISRCDHKALDEKRLAKALADEARYSTMANRADELLGRLLGKIKDLGVVDTATLEQVLGSGKPVTASVLDELAAAQRARQEEVLRHERN